MINVGYIARLRAEPMSNFFAELPALSGRGNQGPEVSIIGIYQRATISGPCRAKGTIDLPIQRATSIYEATFDAT